MPSKAGARTKARLEALGRDLRRARESVGVSRNRAALRVRMDPANYAKIERGQKNVTFDTLLRIADALGLELRITLAPPGISSRAGGSHGEQEDR